MATGMKYWLCTVAAACAAVAVALLPPAMQGSSRPEPTAEELRFRQIWTEVARAHGVLQANRWSDSLSALTLRTEEDRLALGAPPSERVTPEGLEEWRLLHAAPHAALQPRDPNMLVGFFFQPSRHGAQPEVPGFATGSRRQTYVGVRDGSAYCLQVQPVPNYMYGLDNAELRSPAGTGLGACEPYAKYGMPGREVNEWLEAGALALALDGSMDRSDDRLLGRQATHAQPFGLNRPFGENVVVARCLAEDRAACVRAVTDPEILATGSTEFRGDPTWLAANSPISHVEDSYGALTSFRQKSAFLLGDLEAEFGPDAFARFWTSDEPVPAAFATAFGVELGDWVLAWTDVEIGHFRAGPGLHGSALLWALLTLTALSGLGSGVAMRRRVG